VDAEEKERKETEKRLTGPVKSQKHKNQNKNKERKNGKKTPPHRSRS